MFCNLSQTSSIILGTFNSLPNDKFLDLSKLKEFAEDNFQFDKNGKKFSKRVENTVKKEKLLVTSNFYCFHSGFKRLVLQTHKNQGLFGKGLNCSLKNAFNLDKYTFWQFVIELNLYHTIPNSNDPEKQSFWKLCG